MIEAGTSTDPAQFEPQVEVTEKISAPVVITRVLRKRKRKRIRASLINTSNCRYDLVRYTASKFTMKESLENWNVYWTDLSISVQRCKEMKRFQRINHFPGMLEICRKDLLARNLNRMFKVFPEEYNVFPKTWCLPTDMTEVAEYAKNHKGRCFIVKPDLGCQGRGISITRNINQLKTYEKMICQLYIQRPFLIDGYKFDLRIYTLITSCDPLRVFVYNEGLARFATAKYKEPNSVNASNMFMHLTNYSVNKHSRTYSVDEIDGSKRKLSTINQWFLKNNFDIKKIWDSIDDAIIKTVIVSLPTLRHYYHTCFPNHISSHACFEILGFDFMFDHRLKPYVLEVNHSPSFHTDTAIDHEVKESLLYDTFNILNLSQNNRIKVLIEDKKRARDRLFTATLSNDILNKEREKDDKLTESRTEWEDSHLGNYRKIYPNDNIDYYEKFIGARQNTVYTAKEASSKVQGEHEKRATTKMNKVPSEPPPKPKEIPEVISDLPPKPKSAPGTCPPIPKNFEPGFIDEIDEKERVMAMEKREFLVRSHGILEKVYENMKNAGLLKMEDEIKHSRSNKWEDVGGAPKTYRERYQHFNKSMATVLECASIKMDTKFVRVKPLLETLVEEQEAQALVVDHKAIKDEKATEDQYTQDTWEHRDLPLPLLNTENKTSETPKILDGVKALLTETFELIDNKESPMKPNKLKTIAMVKCPEPKCMAEGNSTKKPTERQELRLGPNQQGIKLIRSGAKLTPANPATPGITTPILKVGHFGTPGVWPSLEHYMAHRTILNRNWQNND